MYGYIEIEILLRGETSLEEVVQKTLGLQKPLDFIIN